ncbi:MAG: hypothetical protein JJ992_08850, partial [Planctomycetes bacterium]|nr:hypothetical protein [Planctomycetota bacterium]
DGDGVPAWMEFYAGTDPTDAGSLLEITDITTAGSSATVEWPAVQGKYYSVNEALRDEFPAGYGVYIDRLRNGRLGHRYVSRYIGSMVADFHRTLLKGGVFLYPPTTDHPRGKLRLLYEANPVAFIAEQAGGRATDGQRRILDLTPTSIHQRTSLVVGGCMEMDELERCIPVLEQGRGDTI